jgi:hypothetical protein
MSKIELYADEQNLWHAEVLYSLFKHNVTLAELQEMVAQMKRKGIVFHNPRFAKILKSLQDQGALGALPDLAERCAVMPELLLGGETHPTPPKQLFICGALWCCRR